MMNKQPTMNDDSTIEIDFAIPSVERNCDSFLRAVPDIQMPDVQMPDIQMPDVQVPDVQVPDVQMPDVQMPDIQMPDVQMPDVQVPDVQVPDIQMPNVQMPDVQVPDVQMPDVQVPDVQVPDVQMPDVQLPDVQMPDVQVPDIQPDVQVPDVQMPDVQMPDVQVPDVQVPDVQVPDVQVPDVQPDVQVPDVQVPDVQVPDVQVPDVQVPDVQVPDVQVPDIQMPDVQVPDVQVPDVQMPDVQVPDVQSDVQMPDIQVPDVQVPDIQMPDVQVPDVQMPDVQVPDVQSDVQMPDIQVPDVLVLDLNDDLPIGMNFAVPSVERNHDSLLRVLRRKRERKPLKARRWPKICLMFDEIISDNTQLILRAVFPGAISHRSAHRRRKRTVFPSESSSPEDSRVIPSSDQIPLKYSKDPHDFPKYQLIITNGSISRTESYEKMEDGDFIIKIIGSGIIYRDFCNRKKSLKFLYQMPNIMKKNKYFYLEAKKYQIFNECFNAFDEKAKEAKKLKKQFAFVLFRKKDGSLDKSRTEVHYLSDGEHTEDKIFKLLLEIYYESNCDYSEIYIYSTNSPCLARHSHVPCMIQAFFIAYILHEKHGIKTIIGYHKPWGLSGSCKKNVPSYSIRDCISTSGIIRTSSQKTNDDTEDEGIKELSLYRQIISEIQNQRFLIEANKHRPERKLQQIYSKMPNSDIKKQFNEIDKNLFNLLKLQKSDSFDGFHEYGADIFKKFTKEISSLLIDDCAANIIEEICSYYRGVFFPWWDKIVEDASSKFLNEQFVDKLLKNSLHLSLLEIKQIQKELGRIFFDIGYVVETT
ncbi:hypothetical protein PO909_003841 [Leuciscus waleckii]